MNFGNKLYLYKDNGKRVEFKLDLQEWNDFKNREKVECSTNSLRECNVNASEFECLDCNELFSTCVHFDEDVALYDNDDVATIIPKNKSKEKGYCLKMNDKHSRTCTSKNGGNWILAKDSDNLISYVCKCSTPTLFDNNGKYSDCTTFNACLNGSIVEGWESLSDITCKCNANYMPIKLGIYPTCIKESEFKTATHEQIDLDDTFITDAYKGLKLINPCLIDAATNQVVLGAASVQITNGIAHCKILQPEKYVLLQFNDDYLVGNGGKYANGMMSYNLTETIEGTVYEKNTTVEGEYNTGRAIKAMNFKYSDEFPYLQANSANFGGGGPRYQYAAQITSRDSYMFVYDAQIPNQPDPVFGQMISFIPTYVSEFEATRRWFSGNVPYISSTIKSCKSLDIILIHKLTFGSKFPDFNRYGLEDVGKQDLESSELTKKYVPNVICRNGSKIVANIYSPIFTGIYFNNFEDGKLWTHMMSPGKVLVQQYRLLFTDWKPYNITNYTYPYDKYPPFAHDDLGAGLHVDNSFDTEEVSNPPEKYVKYVTNGKTFKWPTSR